MFANEFHFEGVKRFYVIENHQPQFVRAWHGHKKKLNIYSYQRIFIRCRSSWQLGSSKQGITTISHNPKRNILHNTGITRVCKMDWWIQHLEQIIGIFYQLLMKVKVMTSVILVGDIGIFGKLKKDKKITSYPPKKTVAIVETYNSLELNYLVEVFKYHHHLLMLLSRSNDSIDGTAWIR